MSTVNTFQSSEPLLLESGEILQDYHLTYHTFGELNENQDNIIWVFHAISGSSNVMEWWGGLFGDGQQYDPKDYFIICVNTLCSPYGSTRPENLDFPLISVRDVVNSQLALAKHLGIYRIHSLIGSSFGGNQALEFAYAFKGKIDHLLLLVSTYRESAFSIATHEAQRIALQADPTFGQKDGGKAGLKAARAMAVLNYRTHDLFVEQQTNEDDRLDDFKAASYIQHMGEKFVKRFDALCYYYLTKCLDTYDFARGRGSLKDALGQIEIPTMVLGIDSDVLIPIRYQRTLAKHLPNVTYFEISSEYGHDGFLVEKDLIQEKINAFYNTQ